MRGVRGPRVIVPVDVNERLAKFRKLPHSFIEVFTWRAVGLVAAQQSAPAEVTGHSPISFSADERADIRVGEGKAVA